MKLLLCSAFVMPSAGHGGLLIPPSRNNYGNVDPMNFTDLGPARNGGPCVGGTCYWFNQGCFIGAKECTRKMPAAGNCYGAEEIVPSMEPTMNDARYLTFNLANKSKHGDWTRYHPWRAPGRAPTDDPCGLAGGYMGPEVIGGKSVPPGAQYGDLGSQLPPLDGVHTTWVAGATAEVGWMMAADHGGGYLFSLCPRGASLSEECFQQRPLAFADAEHTIRHIDGSQPDFNIPALDVSEGTFPRGSAWRRNPIPACNCDFGAHCGDPVSEDCATPDCDEWAPYDMDPPANATSPAGAHCPTGTQFPPPFEGAFWSGVYKEEFLRWMMVDRIRVPDTPGDFVLRWRWDTENHPQVWTNCADVTIVTDTVAV